MQYLQVVVFLGTIFLLGFLTGFAIAWRKGRKMYDEMHAAHEHLENALSRNMQWYRRHWEETILKDIIAKEGEK